MEARLVLFLALASFVLIANTFAIWFAFRAFSKVTGSVTQAMRDFENDPTTKGWLKNLEIASHQAVSATAAVKKQLNEFEPVLADAQSTFGYGLAKIDVTFDRFCNNVSKKAEETQNAIIRPAEKFGEMAAGIQGAVAFTQIALTPESDADATPTPRR
jgi:hypothetical protein